MNQETIIREIGQFVVREKYPIGSGTKRLLLMLHGWTGDENSMWIFSPRIPENYYLIAPRGITKTPLGGYGWQDVNSKGWPSADDFSPAVEAILELTSVIDLPELDRQSFDLLGFSQGAALAFAFALIYPQRIGKIAGLSGFLPEGLDDRIESASLKGKMVFVAHGSRDEMVSVSKARQVVSELKKAEAEVIYCEEDVGHKLSANCFRGMGEYFSAPIE